MEGKKSQLTPQRTDLLGGGNFVTEGGNVSLTLTYDDLSWTTAKDNKTVVLEWRDVIRCHTGRVSTRNTVEIQEGTEKEPCFTVHYIEKHENHVWKHKYKIFESSNSNFDVMLSIMNGQCKRDHPERLLVIINPVGGSGKGKSQYSHVVAPLFKLAQIDTDVIVSKDPNQTEEIANTYDFSTVDGVVIVGGDGTYQHLINTWLPRLQKEEGIDMTDPNKDLKSLPCPIGMIPTGTGNGLARGEYGCHDVGTAALHIIAGRRLWKHLAGVTSCKRHLGFSGIVLATGSWSDMLDQDMHYRWLGFFRYPICAVLSLVRMRREFDMRLDYLPYVSHKGDQSPSQLEWESIEGRYTGVISLPGILRKNEATGKLKADLDAEGLTLILEKQCGRLKYFSWLMNIQKMHNDMFEEDFITAKQVTAYKLKIVHKKGEEKTEHEIHCENRCRSDGEVRQLEKSEMDVRVHPRLVEMFGTGEV